MKETLEDIRVKLMENAYQNREHVRFSLIGLILQKSGWDIWNPLEVFPDFTPGSSETGGNVDLALFAAPSIPSVFLDIMAAGKLETDMTRFETLLQYYAAEKQPWFFILTDGRHWRFYCAQYSEKFPNNCFKTLDMLEDSVEALESAFSMYLFRAALTDGTAYKKAVEYLRHNALAQAVTEVLPKARVLVNEPPFPRLPEAIVQLVALQGLEITEDDVITILQSTEQKKGSPEQQAALPRPQVQPEPSEPQESPKPPVQPVTTPSPSLQEERGKQVKKTLITDYLYKQIKSFTFLGQTYHPKSWKDMLITFCEIIYQRHTNDFYNCIKLRVNNLRCFSKNIKDFFGNAPVQIDDSEYYVMTNVNANHVVFLVYNMMKLFGYKKEDIEIIID
jgi:hypothetical protein